LEDLVAGVRSATSTPNDDRQTRLDADQLRTHFELKAAEARKGLGGGGFGGVQVEVARVVRRWLRSATGLPRVAVARYVYGAVSVRRTAVSLLTFLGWALARLLTYSSMWAAYEASAADPEGQSA
jgi:hypothetical protein